MTTLLRYDISAFSGDYYGQPAAYLEKDLCSDGDWVRVDDLKVWLRNHLRDKKSYELYSDLIKQLGDQP